MHFFGGNYSLINKYAKHTTNQGSVIVYLFISRIFAANEDIFGFDELGVWRLWFVEPRGTTSIGKRKFEESR